jgi:3-deoxy-D-manno-octulosonic-acid transferase
MNLSYADYKFITSGLFVALFPPLCLYSRLSGKHFSSIRQKAGYYPEELVQSISGCSRIWMHAVSVGEVSAAVPIIQSLAECIPHCAFIISTGTEHGQAFAKEKIGSTAHCVFAPVDSFLSTRRALQALKPDILVCIETEIWPNWLMEAHRLGTGIALVNGRISMRSIRRYLKIRSLMQEILGHVHAFSMISEADAARIQQIGAPASRIEINGNAKYDRLIHEADKRIQTAMMKRYQLDGNRPVFVAGSIRGQEADIVLDVYEKIIQTIPETILIIAPRHVKRVRRIEAKIRAKGLSSQLRTELEGADAIRSASIIIIDTMGELPATYSIASVVFCGGSLVPRGGQNVLEAAVWAKPVLYGPSMEDFLDAKTMLDETGGGIQINDGQDLAEKVLFFINHPQEAEAVGRCAQKAVSSHTGAAEKHARVIQRVLEERSVGV